MRIQNRFHSSCTDHRCIPRLPSPLLSMLSVCSSSILWVQVEFETLRIRWSLTWDSLRLTVSIRPIIIVWWTLLLTITSLRCPGNSCLSLILRRTVRQWKGLNFWRRKQSERGSYLGSWTRCWFRNKGLCRFTCPREALSVTRIYSWLRYRGK